MVDNELFREIGFTDREAKVYLALLDLGQSTVGPLSNKTRIQQSKIYETLNKLIDKGLVTYIIVSKTKHFKASPPKQILRILEEKERKFKEVIKDLEARQKSSASNQTALVHEGFKAFKALFNNISEELKKGDFYWAFAFKEQYLSFTPSLFLQKFHEKLALKKIDDKLLGNIDVKKEIKKTFQTNKNIKIRFTKGDTPLGVIIIKNKVINLIWGEKPTAIEIQSEQIYEQYKRFFSETWKKANN